MDGLRRSLTGLVGGLCTATALVACGDTPTISQATTAPPLVAPTVDVTLTGNTVVTIQNPSSDVRFKLDDARLLNIHMVVRSTASTPQTVAIRASLFDAGGRLIGDASGGQLAVPPGGEASFDLSGPTPNGTIAKAIFEIRATQPPGG
jgi:hypothetical protein